MSVVVTRTTPSSERAEKHQNAGIPARNRRMIALLDSFDAGDVDEQRRDLTQLMANLAESRAGQRALFAEDHTAAEESIS